MFSPFERFLAFRYLRARKAEGFVSVIAAFSFLGILLGVATLIIVMSVMNGFRTELFGRILGLNGHMNVYAPSGPLTDYDYLRSQIVNLADMDQVTPTIEGQALLSREGFAGGVMVRGLSWQDFTNRKMLRESIIAGNLDDYKDNALAVGRVLAEKFHLKTGDTITLTAPQVKSTPFGSMPRQRAYKIAVIFDVEMYEYNSGFVFMPLDSAQIFFGMPGAVTTLEIFLKDSSLLDEARAAVDLALKGQAQVYDWRDTNKSFFNALQVERNVMFIILTLIILVAAFNIISSMMMLVKDKGRDIAILRTMGASRLNMMKIFILTGASIGVAGTAFGAVAGIAFAMNIETIRQALQSLTGTNLFSDEIYFLSKLPAEIEWHEVGAVITMALVLSVLATVYPAWRAARLDPVEALRNE
jgi:lipoprotein-releasing system permease protein